MKKEKDYINAFKILKSSITSTEPNFSAFLKYFDFLLTFSSDTLKSIITFHETLCPEVPKNVK